MSPCHDDTAEAAKEGLRRAGLTAARLTGTAKLAPLSHTFRPVQRCIELGVMHGCSCNGRGRTLRRDRTEVGKLCGADGSHLKAESIGERCFLGCHRRRRL
mmetsp:Transcript_12512/g.35147  ORF Transcript_12512/g.35147 Transcript_12512/m.35147 type:complete len:101 (+) Transcript_12512:3397-3699(+)